MKALALAAFCTVALLASTCATSNTHANSAQQVRVSNAWVRILPGDLPAAGYATMENTGAQPVSLTGARSADYADVMLHQSSAAGGTNRMRMVDAMSVPAHAQAQLAPGGYHLMLTTARHPVAPGDQVPVTLTFADGSTLDTHFIARPANATDAGAVPAAAASHTQHGH